MQTGSIGCSGHNDIMACNVSLNTLTRLFYTYQWTCNLHKHNGKKWKLLSTQTPFKHSKSALCLPSIYIKMTVFLFPTKSKLVHINSANITIIEDKNSQNMSAVYKLHHYTFRRISREIFGLCFPCCSFITELNINDIPQSLASYLQESFVKIFLQAWNSLHINSKYFCPNN